MEQGKGRESELVTIMRELEMVVESLAIRGEKLGERLEPLMAPGDRGPGRDEQRVRIPARSPLGDSLSGAHFKLVVLRDELQRLEDRLAV